MGPAANILDSAALDVHAADENRVRPGKVIGGGVTHVFVNEADYPALRKDCRDEEQTLRRHEGANTIRQRIGVFKGAKGRHIARKHTEDVARGLILRLTCAVSGTCEFLRSALHRSFPDAG